MFAGAACIIELDQKDDGAVNQRDKEVLEQLYRTMKWCSNRQYMIDLADGSYRSVLGPVVITEFFLRYSKQCEVSCDTPPVLIFDDKMASIAIENAVSNALINNHGASVRINVFLGESNASNPILIICIRNYVATNEALTTEKLMGFLHLSSSPFSRHFEDPERFTAQSQRASSTRSGLRHLQMACRGAGASFDLRVESNLSGNDEVVATFQFPCKISSTAAPSLHTPSSANEVPQKLPPSVRVFAIDDSKARQLVMCHNVFSQRLTIIS